MTVEIDSLQESIKKLFEAITSYPKESSIETIYQSVLEPFYQESNRLFDNIEGMSYFLLMNINRAQDFVKASSGIYLEIYL